MKIINLPRAAGKTTQAIRLSVKKHIPILCATLSQRQIICDKAKEMGVQLITPILVDELSGITQDTEFIIDELDFVLSRLIENITGHRARIDTVTVSDDENKNKNYRGIIFQGLLIYHSDIKEKDSKIEDL